MGMYDRLSCQGKVLLAYLRAQNKRNFRSADLRHWGMLTVAELLEHGFIEPDVASGGYFLTETKSCSMAA